MGSVGEMSAPKKKHSSQVAGMLIAASVHRINTEINTVESSVPHIERTVTASFSRASSFRSRKNAPANSKSPNMPCRINCSKLTCRTRLVAQRWIPGA